MKTAAAYVRVSTEKQDEYSLDSQLRLIWEYAAAHELILPPDLVFVEDGVSGRTVKKRPAFQTMIAMAKDRAFDVILVWKFSRFARNQEESIVYKSMLGRCGVEVVSVSEPLDDSPFGSLIERIIEWMDEFYSIRLAGEVKRGMAEKVSRAEIVTRPPFGYAVEGRTFVPSPEAETVRRIFSDFAAGKALREITLDLGASGVRTRGGNVPSTRWLRYMLKNPVYVGKIRWSADGKVDYMRETADEADLIDGDFEPLVSAETWEAVRRRLRRRDEDLPFTRHDQPADWMLKGLVRCSACGATLVYQKKYKGMQCHGYCLGRCGVSHYLSTAKANRAVVAELERCADLGVFTLAPPVRPAGEGPDFLRLISAEEQKLRRVQEAYEAGVDSLEEYARKKAKISAGIAQLRRQAARSDPQLSAADMQAKTRGVLDILKSPAATEAEKNAALRTILSHVVFDKPASQLVLYFRF